MLLKDYISENQIDIAKFSRMLGVTRQTVYNWMSGLNVPTLINYLTIKSISGGKVTSEDLAAPFVERNKG